MQTLEQVKRNVVDQQYVQRMIYDYAAKMNLAKVGPLMASLIVEEASTVVMAFKVVEVVKTPDGKDRYYSVVRSGWTKEYFLGVPEIQIAMADHGGGFYVYAAASPHELAEKFVRGDIIKVDSFDRHYGILSCECRGPFCFYDKYGNMVDGNIGTVKKAAVSYLKPIRYQGDIINPSVRRVVRRDVAAQNGNAVRARREFRRGLEKQGRW